MTDTQIQDPIDQIADEMVKEIEAAEEKDKEIEVTQEGFTASEPEVGVEEAEEKRQKRKKSHEKVQLANLQRENARIAEEARLIAEENLALRNQYEAAVTKAQTSGDAAMAHYQNGINLRVSQLKEELKKAHENNDTDSITDINFELGMLASEAKDIKAHNLLQAQYQQQVLQNQYNYPYNYSSQIPQVPQEAPIEIRDETKEWVNRNPWLIQGHEDFDPEKIEEVLTYSKMLDLNLRRHGKEDQIHSEDYYNALDQYVQSVFENEGGSPSTSPPSPPVRQSSNLEQSFSHNSRVPVAPVRKSASGNYNSSSKNVKFSDVDKDMMQQLQRYGVTPQAYARAKLQTNDQYQKAADSGDLNSLQAWGLI
jgi:hypothetical protein